MHPQIYLNWTAIVAAVVASFVFGWLWHGPLFGKLWCKLMKITMPKKPDPKAMLRPMALTILGTFLIAYVMNSNVAVWRPSTWSVGADAAPYVYGFFAGFFVWLGYFIPQQLSAVAWERRSWGIFGLNLAFHFINLQIIAMIVAHWR